MTKSLTLPDAERDHVSGSANGSIKLLEYGDYECPFCADAQPIVKEIQRRLGDDLLFAFRHFPLANIHPHSEHAAEAGELGLDATRLTREVTSTVYARRIREDFRDGVRAGVNGTPTLFINGERYDGVRDLKHLLNALTAM